MRVRFRYVFLGFSLFGVASAQGAEFGLWSEFLPQSSPAKAQVMVLGAPEDVQAISDKVEAAQRADPDFFAAQRANAEPGEPIKYDERLGISEEEYQRLLEGATEVQLRSAGEAELSFSIDRVGLAVLEGLPISPPHNTLKYDMEQSTMYTPYGDLNILAKVAQEDVNAPTGPWDGYQWNLAQQESEDDYSYVAFAIGKLRNKPQNLIYYDVNISREGKSHQYHYVLIYDAQ